MDSLIGGGACLEPQEIKQIQTITPLPEDANKNVPPVPANKLCEDELLLIFRNCCITPKDLLNFRLVNKSWRDAATGTLLQRDACSVHVSLHKAQQNSNKAEVTDFSYYRDKLDVGNDEDKKALLTMFVKRAIVMKNSSKFPSSTLCIYPFEFFPTDNPTTTNYLDHLDLTLFFAHHRDKIKTISPRGGVTKKNLHDILFLFTPQLECLDLSEAELIPSALEDDADDNSNWDSKLLPFKSLILGKANNTKISREIMSLLLTFPSNLCCIQNLHLVHLPEILEAGKAHLTSSFAFTCFSNEAYVNDIPQFVPLMKQFSEKNPKLSKLVLFIKSSDFYFDTILSLNQIIMSSKDTMKDLIINLNDFNLDDDPDKLLHIPSMLNLESIFLNISLNYHSHQLDDLALELNEGKKLFSFENQVSGDKYFPRLAKVTLESFSPFVKQNTLCFISKILYKIGVDTIRNYLFRVENLMLHYCNLPQSSYVSRVCDIFPNIRYLHLTFSLELVNTSNSNSLSLWLQCPSVEFIEIYGIGIGVNNINDMVSVSTFDVFFTGFSPAMCQKLRQEKLPQIIMDNPEALKFLQITPSVCDLKYLKELRMEFSSSFLVCEFASHVTGVYAFSKMENTKFVVSYNALVWKHNIKQRKLIQDMEDENIDDKAEVVAEYHKNEDVDIDELCFGSLKPYVCFEHHASMF